MTNDDAENQPWATEQGVRRTWDKLIEWSRAYHRLGDDGITVKAWLIWHIASRLEKAEKRVKELESGPPCQRCADEESDGKAMSGYWERHPEGP